MKVLDVGFGGFSRAPELLPNIKYKLTTMDARADVNPDIVHDLTQPMPSKLVGKFDCVIASHVLEHIDWRTAMAVFANLITVLKPGGSIWILVPDLEYLAYQVIKGNMDIGFMGGLYGGQAYPFDYHHCGFTSDTLRRAAERLGLTVRQLYKTGVKIILDGKEYDSQQVIMEAICAS